MTSLVPWQQDDGSIVDIYGNRISERKALEIITTVNSLPARKEKDNFLHAIKNHPIIIVQGETGSGKSTQLPKFAHFANPNENIVVTQPRVFSATSLAERVSMEILSELGDPRYSLGERIGYRTGRGKIGTHNTRLSYNTDGTEFMRQAMSGLIPNLLFIDEAHGFSVQTETLAMLARHHERAMKIVIMSATLDPEIFREYYKDISTDIPLISIPGRTFGVTSDFDARWNELMADIEDAIQNKQNILLFAPGKKEIEDHIKALKTKFWDSVEILPLHAEMPASEQNKLLTKNTDLPRIIVATNVAFHISTLLLILELKKFCDILAMEHRFSDLRILHIPTHSRELDVLDELSQEHTRDTMPLLLQISSGILRHRFSVRWSIDIYSRSYHKISILWIWFLIVKKLENLHFFIM